MAIQRAKKPGAQDAERGVQHDDQADDHPADARGSSLATGKYIANITSSHEEMFPAFASRLAGRLS